MQHCPGIFIFRIPTEKSSDHLESKSSDSLGAVVTGNSHCSSALPMCIEDEDRLRSHSPESEFNPQQSHNNANLPIDPREKQRFEVIRSGAACTVLVVITDFYQYILHTIPPTL
jgi:hypothetical protein